MKVRFLKKHLDWRAGDEATLDDGIATYMISLGVLVSADADPAKTEAVLLGHLEENKKVKKQKKNK